MALKLSKYLRDVLGANLLLLGTEDHVPGALLNRVNFLVEGDIRNILSGAGHDFSLVRKKAAMPAVTVSESHKVAASGAVLGVISIDASAGSSLSVAYEVAEMDYVRMVKFRKMDLVSLLNELENADMGKAKQFAHHFLITETYYATRVKAKFSQNGQVMAKAAIEGKVSVSAGMQSEWKSDETLEVAGVAGVPFAFSGWIPQI